ncbi:hypothetical protein HDU85_001207 [Gaertneriomyces sp. JEL0708]|nr:hypothetical protein HDU85_001207 [Gaertneriomyces sp. JEL0708]
MVPSSTTIFAAFATFALAGISPTYGAGAKAVYTLQEYLDPGCDAEQVTAYTFNMKAADEKADMTCAQLARLLNENVEAPVEFGSCKPGRAPASLGAVAYGPTKDWDEPLNVQAYRVVCVDQPASTMLQRARLSEGQCEYIAVGDPSPVANFEEVTSAFDWDEYVNAMRCSDGTFQYYETDGCGSFGYMELTAAGTGEICATAEWPLSHSTSTEFPESHAVWYGLPPGATPYNGALKGRQHVALSALFAVLVASVAFTL